MLNGIISFSIRNKLIIGLFTLGLVGYGAYQATLLPIDAVPDITDNQVQVITATPSLGAPDVERLITFPIEQASSNIPGLKEMRSFSRFGLSLITLVFEDDVDVYWARQQVTERLKVAETQIPQGVGTPELGPVTTGLGEIYQYVIRPAPGYTSRYGPIELRTIQDWLVRRQLLGVKGVADVSSFGGRLKQYEIAVDAGKMHAHRVSIKEVFSALEKNNENTGGGYIEKAGTVTYIRAEGLLSSVEDILATPLKNLENGQPLLLSEVAEVQVGYATRYGAITYNDVGEVAGGVVMMLKGDNSSRVIGEVKEKISQIERTLPPGILIEPFLDRTKMVRSAIGTVTTNLMEGALIIIFVLVLFLGNLRAGLLVASVIPLSLLFAVILMNQFGVSGNLMSLGALDFGLIVDGAVIVVEAVMHGMAQYPRLGGALRLEQEQMDSEVAGSAGKMLNSAVFGQIIILVVYLPIFALEGIEGKMFHPMAQTVTFALLGAFILSLTYVPMMSALVLSRQTDHRENFSDRMMAFFSRQQQRTLQRIIRIPRVVLLAVAFVFLVSIGLLTRLGGEFIPELPEGDFAVDTRVLTGSNLNTSTEACLKSAHILLKQFPEVEKVVSKTGSGEIPTDPMPMEASDMMVILKDRKEWVSASTWEELANRMAEALQTIPGVTYGFQYPVAMRFNELMTGARQDVVCKLFGENLDTLSHYAAELGRLARRIPGAENVFVEPIDGLPQLVIRYDRTKLAAYGIPIRDLNDAVQTALAGRSSGLIFEDEKRFDLVVRLRGESRRNLEDLRNLLVATPAGNQIPLQLIAKVDLEESVNQIQREDAKRRIIVGFNVGERDVQSVVEDLQASIAKVIRFPTGYFVTFGGSFENLMAARQRLLVAVPMALLLVFIFLYFAFGNIKQGLLIYSAIPLSAMGGIFFLALRDMPFSISAGIGFIALFGVSVLNGLVLVAEFNRIRSQGLEDLAEVVMQGTRTRLRPVLMTGLVASLGFLPMAISQGAGAEVQRPLATVVIGGLLIATLLTLFVLPILYILFEKRKPMVRSSSLPLLLLPFFLLPGKSLEAQQAISADQAVRLALLDNLGIKGEKLRGAYLEKQIGSFRDIPPLEITGEFGQINSAYLDTRVGVTQSFHLPAYYRLQRELYQEAHRENSFTKNLLVKELTRQVRSTFYRLVYLREKEKLLLRSDSIYIGMVEKSALRAGLGETLGLERILAESARGKIQLQLLSLKKEEEIEQMNLRTWVNRDTMTFTLDCPSLKWSDWANTWGDSSGLNGHPRILLQEQKQVIAAAETRLEIARKLPVLRLAYNNVSFRGIGADEQFYRGTQRFSSLQAGMSIPLFPAAWNARIEMARLQENLQANATERERKEHARDLEHHRADWFRHREAVRYFEETALPNAEILQQAADLQLRTGEINFLSWAGIIQQVIALRLEYLEAVDHLNQTLFHLDFLTQP